MTNKEHIRFSIDAGADEPIADSPRNYFKAPSLRAAGEAIQPALQNEALDRHGSSSLAMTKMIPPSLAASNARELADKATTMAELEAAIRAFDGCGLKKTASKTVFGDGNPQAKLLVIGEAPGADEDRQGIPFCGVSGQLLDKMFAAIGYDRTKFFISNTVYWRPPGNRQPTTEETQICLPFVEKLIALIKPELLVFAGGTATTTLLGRNESMSKLRGKTYDYSNPYLTSPIRAIATYHPSYLLRQPSQKRQAWQDMLMVQSLIG